MERNPLLPDAAQRRQPVADLLEAGAEALFQELDVITNFLGRLEEGVIGHHDHTRKIIGQGHATKRGGVVGGERGPGLVAGPDHVVRAVAERVPANLPPTTAARTATSS